MTGMYGYEMDGASALVRPYAVTGGRTRPRYELALESLVFSERGRDGAPLTPECQAILDLCKVWRSVAEVSALTRMPLGVARVLIADLLHDGLVQVQQPQGGPGGRPDLALMERVLSGLRGL